MKITNIHKAGEPTKIIVLPNTPAVLRKAVADSARQVKDKVVARKKKK